MQTQLPSARENSQDVDNLAAAASTRRDKAGGDNKLVRTDRQAAACVHFAET